MSKEDIKNQYENAENESDDTLLEEPIPLQKAMPTSEPFPIEALGEILAPFVRTMMNVIQAPDGICAQSVLAATALAVQGHANAVVDGRIMPLSEFFLTIGESGERKSAVDSIVLKPHRDHQNISWIEYESEVLDWKAKWEAYESQKKDILKKAKSYAERLKYTDVIGHPPKKPFDPFILTDDPTIEGLTKMLITGRPSVGLFSEEGGRFVGGHSMNKDNLLKTASSLSSLWDGKQMTRIRVSDEKVLLEGKRLSFHLMVQPIVAQLMLTNPTLIDQGFLSRCLISFPTSTAGTRLYKEGNVTATIEYHKYQSMINEIMNQKLPLITDDRNELAPRQLPISEVAKLAYIEFHNKIETEIGNNGRFSSIRGFANKVAEHALRLAGIITMFYDMSANVISTDAMESGITLASYYLSEALRLRDTSICNPEIIQAELLLTWLHTQESDCIPLIDMYQRGPHSIRDAATARKLIYILYEHNWVTPLPNGIKKDGFFRKEAWKIRR